MDDKKEYVPEQLEDEEFEKEKAEKKKLKEQKKAEKKAKKEKIKKEEIAEDEEMEENNTGKSKKKIITIIAIILILAIIIAGIIVYFIINKNKPENIIYDCASYFNDKNWDEFINCIDFKGYYALGYLGTEEFTKFDESYNEIEDIEDYKDYNEFMNTFMPYKKDIFDASFKDVTINIDKIISVNKIENTKSLYKVKANITLSDKEQSQTNAVDFYVTKVDKKFKIVEGFFPYLVYTQFSDYFNYIYNSLLTNQGSQE